MYFCDKCEAYVTARAYVCVYVCMCAACVRGASKKALLSTSGAICQWQGRNANQMQSDNTPRSLPPLEQPTEIN